MTQLEREIDAMKSVNHPNILNLKGVDMDQRFTYDDSTRDVVMLVLELAGGGELFDFLMYTGAFQEDIARSFFHQLLSALDLCHNNLIYHRDIKPENLLLDESFSLKVADFGLSSVQDEENAVLRTECGTRSYMAPEVMTGEGYDGSMADIWSCGVVLFIMLAGNPPFQIANRQDWWFNAVSLGRHDRFWAAHLRTCPTFPPAARELLNKIFVADPTSRASISEIFEDEWMQGTVIPPEELGKELRRRKARVDAQKDRERRAAEAKKRQKAARRNKNDPFAKNTRRSVVDEDELVAPPFPQDRSVDYRTSFFTADTPSHVLSSLQDAFSTRKAEVNVEDELCRMNVTLLVEGGVLEIEEETVKLPDQPMRLTCNLYLTEGGSHFVEMKRTDGDFFAFSQLFEAVKEELSEIVIGEDEEVEGEELDEEEEDLLLGGDDEEEEDLLTDGVGMI